jgi:hypothetical protein
MTSVNLRPAPPLLDHEPVRVRAHRASVKHLGEWTTAHRFDVRASQSSVVLDLVLPDLEPGDIEIYLDVDHSMVKLLVPEGTHLDHEDLRRVGRGKVTDWTGRAAPGGQVVRVLGELRHSEVRARRGGLALTSLVLYGHGGAVRRAHQDGRLSWEKDAKP